MESASRGRREIQSVIHFEAGSKIENRGYNFLIIELRNGVARTGGLLILNDEEDLDVYGVRLLGLGSNDGEGLQCVKLYIFREV